MTIPAMGALAASIYHELRLIVPDDEANGWPFANYIAAMFSPGENVESWARDTDAGPGWSILVDLARCPIIALPWLGQINGVEIPPSLDSSLWRAYIGSARGMQRHSPASLIAAGQTHLAGTKSVRVVSRTGPTAYDTTIITRTAETPDTDLVRTNEVTNPSFEVNTTGWAGGWSALTARQSGWSSVGTWSARLTTNAMGVAGQNPYQALGPLTGPLAGAYAITPGERVSAAAVFNLLSRTGNGGVYVQINWVTAAGAFISAATGNVITALGVTRSVINGAIAPATAAGYLVYLIANEGSPNPPTSTIDAYADAVQVHRGYAVCPAYGDGSTTGWVWDGTANASTSHRIPTTIVLNDLKAAKRIGIRLTHVISDAPLIDEGTRTIDASTGTIDTALLTDIT